MKNSVKIVASIAICTLCFLFLKSHTPEKAVQITFLDKDSNDPIAGVICSASSEYDEIYISNHQGVVFVPKNICMNLLKAGYADTLICLKKDSKIKLKRSSCKLDDVDRMSTLLKILDTAQYYAYIQRDFILEIDPNSADTNGITFYQTKFVLDKSKKWNNSNSSQIFDNSKVGQVFSWKIVSIEKYNTKKYIKSDMIFFDHLFSRIDTSVFSDLYSDQSLWKFNAKEYNFDSCDVSYNILKQKDNYGLKKRVFSNSILEMNANFHNNKLTIISKRQSVSKSSPNIDAYGGEELFSYYIEGFDLPILSERWMNMNLVIENNQRKTKYLIFKLIYLNVKEKYSQLSYEGKSENLNVRKISYDSLKSFFIKGQNTVSLSKFEMFFLTESE